MGLGSRTRFQTSVNCSKVELPPKRLAKWRYQSRGEIRPSCQSDQRGSFSMAVHSSAGEREPAAARPCMARETSIRIRTRPISKMMARSFEAGMGYLTLRLAKAGPEGVSGVRFERRTPITAGSIKKIG